jgi:methylthioribose-1-phosphate isomerase
MLFYKINLSNYFLNKLWLTHLKKRPDMNINGKHFETIQIRNGEKPVIQIIDQRLLPFRFEMKDLHTVKEIYSAISEMMVRGAPLIGASAAAGMYLSLFEYNGTSDVDEYIDNTARYLETSRPTAVNLSYAVKAMVLEIKKGTSLNTKINIARAAAQHIIDTERENCLSIGEFGLPVIEKIAREKKGKPVNILTHCNAGWLACIDYGTATAPIYLAHDKGINVHVWVDETRPRNQGSKLTAWELQQHGVPCTIIADNTGGHLMQHGMVDMVIVGCDRATANGDVANKIGTYLKALAAKDNDVPFYVALPSSSFDWTIADGIKEIVIEERGAEEIKYIEGLYNDKIISMLITDGGSNATNYAFDVTPARLITGLITEKGICKAEKESILNLFPDKKGEIR